MGNYNSVQLTDKVASTTPEGNIIIYKHCDFKGETQRLSVGEYSQKDLDNLTIDDNIISSLILGPNTQVTFYEFDQYKGQRLTLINKTIDQDYLYACFRNATNTFANQTWDNRPTSFKISLVQPKVGTGQPTTPPDYNVRFRIGDDVHTFKYGTYHHIWMNTNERPLVIDTFPSENVRLELFTGYHPGQGRMTLVDRKKNEIIINNGIIRSANVIKVRYLKPKKTDITPTYINDGVRISHDYQQHIGTRPSRKRELNIYFKDFEFDTEQNNLKEITTPVDPTSHRVIESFSVEDNNCWMKYGLLLLILSWINLSWNRNHKPYNSL